MHCADCPCTEVEDPVCGVDGLTYGNKCKATCENVKLKCEDACDRCPKENRCGQLNDKLPPSLADMGENMVDVKRSPRSDRDAEILAVRVGTSLVASQATYKRISADLKAIRRVYKYTSSAVLGDGATQALILTSGYYDPLWLDCVNKVYGGKVNDIGQIFTIVRFHRVYNSKLLVAAYTSEPTLIRSAEPDSVVGADSDIRLLNKRVGGTHRYVFSQGTGDCPAGCTDLEYYHFDVTSDGKVTRQLQDPSIPTTECESWCPNFKVDWTKKCSWKQCKGCSECHSNGPDGIWMGRLYCSRRKRCTRECLRFGGW